MAFLVNTQTNQRCFLYAYHSFGRLPYGVDTLVEHPGISKHHAIIEWHDNSWTIRDISRNGCWLNQQKLPKNSRYPLTKIGDTLCFGDPSNALFVIAQLSPPTDLLINLQHNGDDGEKTIELNQYHLLPNEHQPEVVLRFDTPKQQWRIEYCYQSSASQSALNEHDVIEFGGQSWRLHLSRFDTTECLNSPHSIDELNFIFDLSLDEETTELRLQTPEQVIDFKARSHHYLTLHLARCRAADALKGVDNPMQGWVYPEQLLKELGLDISHLNIQIHRIRKQFCDALVGSCNDQALIERQAGKLRFSGSMFKIYKGRQLECQLP